MVAKITITVKGQTANGDGSSYKEDFLEYNDFMMSETDPVIQEHIKTALANTKIQHESIKIRAVIVNE